MILGGANDTDNEAENSEHTETPKRKRRRFADEQSWKRNVQRRKRLRGESYINSKNKIRPAKEVKTVDCKCKFNCRNNITEEQQKSLFSEYYSLDDFERQKDYLNSFITEEPVQRKRKRNEDSGIDKTVSRKYVLPNGNGDFFRVCLPFFCNSFSISKQLTNTILSQRSPNGSFVGRDHRKGRPACNVTPEAATRSVVRFLKEFPKVPSHYCRKRSNRLYLAPDLNIATLHDLYKKRELPPVSQAVFRRIFREQEPPLAIFKPKKDQCTLCNEAERLKPNITEKHKEHIERKTVIASMKEADALSAKGNPKILYGSFDLQAVLTLPFAGDCQIYYTRKLSVFNFCIFDSYGQGSCFLWDETNGKKGSAEIGSCLLWYIENLHPEIEHVVLYSDTCGGQNRNQNVVAALLFAINRPSESKLQTIDLKFLESGHSYMEADSIHAAIEKSKKHKQIYTTNQYATIIQMSRKKSPYKVRQLKFTDFYDLEQLSAVLIQNRNELAKNKKLQWLNVKWFRFERNFKPVVGFKYDPRDDFQYLEVNKNCIQWDQISLHTKYNERLEISTAKKKDLLRLLKKGVIPNDYLTFYKDLPANKKKTDVAVWNNDESDDSPDDEAAV